MVAAWQSSQPLSVILTEESLRVFTTTDYGQTWRKSGRTLIGKPIQNASYLSPAAGFLATREDLYYTRDHGQSFNKATITIPEGYSANELSFFQAPNTIVATGSAKLEATFHLANAKDLPNRKVFACLFQSVNEGKSWTFVQQLSQVVSID